MAEILICNAKDVVEGGKGIRFPVTVGGSDATGFVLRFDGALHAYLNRCAHVPIELDWSPGEFFESSGLYIMCATHGAIYLPDTGYCTGGPCRGARLRKISILEQNGQVFWQSDEYVHPALA
jgi:nitrite reductase/ring-hydroxylating ferredoxin subunit